MKEQLDTTPVIIKANRSSRIYDEDEIFIVFQGDIERNIEVCKATSNGDCADMGCHSESYHDSGWQKDDEEEHCKADSIIFGNNLDSIITIDSGDLESGKGNFSYVTGDLAGEIITAFQEPHFCFQDENPYRAKNGIILKGSGLWDRFYRAVVDELPKK